MEKKQSWFGYWWENIKPAKEGFDIAMVILTALSLFVWTICKWGQFSNPIEDFITDAKLEHWGIIGAGTFYSVLCFIWHPFVRHNKSQQHHEAAIKTRDNEINKLKEEIENDKAKIEIKPELYLENAVEKKAILKVTVFNSGRRIARITKVAVIVLNKGFTVVGTGLKLPEGGRTDLVASQKQLVVDLEPDGGVHYWQFPFIQNPNFEYYEKDREKYGTGYIQLTSGVMIPFEFVLFPDDGWTALAKIRNDVDPTSSLLNYSTELFE